MGDSKRSVVEHTVWVAHMTLSRASSRPSALESKSGPCAESTTSVESHFGLCVRLPPGWEMLRCLRGGYFGELYVVRSEQQRTCRVVKQIEVEGAKRKLSQYGSTLSPRQEYKIQRACDHPGVVSCHEMIQTEKFLGLVFEFLEGGDVKEKLLAHGAFSAAGGFAFGLQILRALQYLHSNEIAHRDVKLENIFCDRTDCEPSLFKLGDFGLAKDARSHSGCRTYCGTLDYMAPEVARVRGAADHREYGQQSDVWSFGVCLYMLLLCAHPYSDDPLYQQVCMGRIEIATALPAFAHVLLRRLLVADHTVRLRAGALRLESPMDFGAMLPS